MATQFGFDSVRFDALGFMVAYHDEVVSVYNGEVEAVFDNIRDAALFAAAYAAGSNRVINAISGIKLSSAFNNEGK